MNPAIVLPYLVLGYLLGSLPFAVIVSRAFGIADPRRQISLMEVHDCFSITELVTMEDLGVSAEGMAVRDVMDGNEN